MKTENMHVKMGEGVGFERIRRITGYPGWHHGQVERCQAS